MSSSRFRRSPITEAVDIESLQEAFAGRYAIERELGCDPRAVEWLARTETGMALLLQVARPDLATGVDPAGFAARIDAIAARRHPRVLPIVDRGEAGGFLFVARPFVEAVSLRTWLQREHALPFLEAVRVLHELADALADAHAGRLVHGALAPASVLWHETHVLVKDLGLAAALAASPPEASEDLCAFGALAYEVLTGARPDPHGVPAPVSARRAHQPPGLAHLVTRCLDPDPAARPSAAELRDRLAVMVTPALGYRATHLVAQAEHLRRRGDAGALRGALERFRRAAELDPRLLSARAGMERARQELAEREDR